MKKNKDINFDDLDDCPAEFKEQFQQSIAAFEQAQRSPAFQILLDSGISLPPPSELTDAELHSKLWEIIHALALMGAYLEQTDHLSDRELYTLLLDDILREDMVIQSAGMDMACHIDLLGSGSEEDTAIYLKYYADEKDRNFWLTDFPKDQLPERERLPYDRDRELPKPYPHNKSAMH
ncbi:MAG: hypothetical protein R8K20_08140 [Gallionellaceae bacterium]